MRKVKDSDITSAVSSLKAFSSNRLTEKRKDLKTESRV